MSFAAWARWAIRRLDKKTEPLGQGMTGGSGNVELIQT
jgi:hypothetical protein